MVDLRKKGLPTTIEVGGQSLAIDTDFRLWIEVNRMVYEEHALPVARIFMYDKGGVLPEGDIVTPLCEFLACKPVTPKARNDNSLDPFDLIWDGDYIVAAFMQAYHIDLTAVDMHWHLFLALFRSLPSNTKMVEIEGYRTWRESDTKKKQATLYKELQEAYKLPPRNTPEDNAIIDWQESAFGGVLERFKNTYKSGERSL